MPTPVNSRLLVNLPTSPDEALDPRLYGIFQQLYNSIRNITNLIGQYTGIDAWQEEDWSQLAFTDTLIVGQQTRLYVPASAAILAGQTVNLHDNAGVLSARLAVATSAATQCHGIATVAAAIGEMVEVQLWLGYTDLIGGMTRGTTYWLSTVAGAIQNSAPVVPGQIQQVVGLALDTSKLAINISSYYRQL